MKQLTPILAALLLPVLSTAASAQFVDVGHMRSRPGGEDFFVVSDPSGCLADVTATSTDPNVRIYAIDMATGQLIPGNGVTVTVQDTALQAFAVITDQNIAAPTFAAIDVCWEGVNVPPGPPGPCIASTCLTPYKIPLDILPHPSTIGPSAYAATMLEPIKTSDGEYFTELKPLASLGGPFPLSIELLYSSYLKRDGNVFSRLGAGWAHNFEWSLQFFGHSVEIYAPDGRVIRFEQDFLTGVYSLALYTDVPFQLALSGPGFWMLLDPRDQTVRMFDNFGKLVTVLDGHGNLLFLNYFGIQLTTVSDPFGRSFNFTYGGLGKLTRITDSFGRAANLTYSGSGDLIAVQDAAGGTTNLLYDPAHPGQGVLRKVTLPRGNSWVEHGFDAQGRAVTELDAFGNAYSLAYGPPGTTTIGAPVGPPRTHVHAGNVLAQNIDETGAAAVYGSDPQGRHVSIVDRLGATTGWTLDPASGYLASETEADGSVTTYAYTPRTFPGVGSFFDLGLVALANGSVETFTYSAGNLASWTDAGGAVRSWTYNSRGQPSTSTNPLGGQTTYAYNPDATLKEWIDPSGDKTELFYDAFKRISSIKLPNGDTYLFAYDAMNRVTSETSPLGNVTAHSYDANGNRTAMVRPLGGTTAFQFDAMDRVQLVTSPTMEQWGFTWNALRQLAGILDPAGVTTSYSHDATGYRSGVTNGLGATILIAHDAEMLPASITDADGDVTSFTKNAMGWLTRTTSALGATWNIAHDELGYPISFTNPNGERVDVQRDANGHVIGMTWPLAGMSASNTRNAMGQVVSATDPDGFTRTVGRNNEGEIVSLTDELLRTTTVQRDTLGRVVGGTFPSGLGTFTVGYNGDGRIVQRAFSDGTTFTYGWDGNGNQASGTGFTATYDVGDRMTSCNGIAMGRGPMGRLTSLMLPSGLMLYEYDAAGNCTKITDPQGRITQFTYSASGQLLTIQRANGVTTAYTYDADGRRSSIHHGSFVAIDILRDTAGRVVHAARIVPLACDPPLGVKTFALDAASQRTGDVYDVRGRVTSSNGTTYTWDLDDNLRSRTTVVGTQTFDWDCSHNLVGLDEAGISRDIKWIRFDGGRWRPQVEYSNGAVEWEEVRTPAGALIYRIHTDAGAGSPVAYYLHEDEWGHASCLSDDSGSLTDSYCHSQEGALLASTGTTDWPYRICAQDGNYTVGQDLHAVRSDCDSDTDMWDAGNARTLAPNIEDYTDTSSCKYLIPQEDRELATVVGVAQEPRELERDYPPVLFSGPAITQGMLEPAAVDPYSESYPRMVNWIWDICPATSNDPTEDSPHNRSLRPGEYCCEIHREAEARLTVEAAMQGTVQPFYGQLLQGPFARTPPNYSAAVMKAKLRHAVVRSTRAQVATAVTARAQPFAAATSTQAPGAPAPTSRSERAIAPDRNNLTDLILFFWFDARPKRTSDQEIDWLRMGNQYTFAGGPPGKDPYGL